MSITIIISTIILLIVPSSTTNSPSDSCHIHADRRFQQINKRFWEFNEQSDSWVEVKLPYDLISCINHSCTVVNSIREERERNPHRTLPLRRRLSVAKLSETSIWVTGESGSVYERFWNGLQWVIAPHDLPLSAGYAVSVFFVNQTILALSEGGLLYQMRLNEDLQPVWVELKPELGPITSGETVQLSFGLASNDREWVNHGRPPGANVSAITDAAIIRQGLLLIVRRSL